LKLGEKMCLKNLLACWPCLQAGRYWLVGFLLARIITIEESQQANWPISHNLD